MSTIQVESTYYGTKKYTALERFISYYFQLDCIRELHPKTVLLVGVGDDVTTSLLKRAGYTVKTLDIDPMLEPDIVADVKSIPLPENSFDVVCAFQVLEHVPYEDFKSALVEIKRVSKQNVIISVPHRRTGIEIVIKFPFMRSLFGREYIRLALLVPVRFGGFESSGQHYWEIDWFTTKLSTVRRDIRKHFIIEREITPVLDPYRRFFVLTTKKDSKD
jgi:ubiquinone/menaquinone biosynthesis C-methylase UbiE